MCIRDRPRRTEKSIWQFHRKPFLRTRPLFWFSVLTKNKMTVPEIYLDGKLYKPEELDTHNQLHRYLLYAAVLTNDSSIVD